MKKIALTLVLTSLPLISFAQTAFSFSGGVAQPIGEYASTDPQGGYAKTGSTWGIRVDNYFPSGFGVGLMIKNHKNQIDDVAMQEDIKSEFGYKYTQLWQSASHKSFGFLVLGSYKFLDVNRFTADVSLGGGGALNDMSSRLSIAASNTQVFRYQQIVVDYNGKFSWAWQAGVRCAYYISPSFGFTASVNYYGTNPTYVIAKQEYATLAETDIKTYSTINHMMDYSIGIVFGR